MSDLILVAPVFAGDVEVEELATAGDDCALN